jgi:hypothetical protein
VSTIAYVASREADNVDRDTWTTPRKITRRLGPVWLDPCSNERSKVEALRTFRLDRGEDGLKLARFVPRNPPGIVFVNPPYSRDQVELWVEAYRHTRFLFLLRYDPSTDWYKLLIKYTSIVAHPHFRVNFDPPPGIVLEGGNHNNPFPHALYARDAADISPELRRVCTLLAPVRGELHA